MKKPMIISLLLISFTLCSFSQSTLKIYTELKEETAKFIVFLNGEKQDAIPMREIEIEELSAGKYELNVAFNSDTIADYYKKIKIPGETTVVYKVIKWGELIKETGKMGRSFGRLFGTTKEDEKEGLKEYYRLVKVSPKK